MQSSKNISYEERLRDLNISLLTQYCVRDDLIQAFKIIKDIDSMDDIIEGKRLQNN